MGRRLGKKMATLHAKGPETDGRASERAGGVGAHHGKLGEREGGVEVPAEGIYMWRWRRHSRRKRRRYMLHAPEKTTAGQWQLGGVKPDQLEGEGMRARA